MVLGLDAGDGDVQDIKLDLGWVQMEKTYTLCLLIIDQLNHLS